MLNPNAPQVDHFARAKSLIAEGEKAQVIDTAEQAAAATAWLGQAKTTFEELDGFRLAEGEPLREKLQAINGEYFPVIKPLDPKVTGSVYLKVRKLLQDYSTLVMRRQEAEERARREEAERRAAEEAARLEREAAAQRKAAQDAAIAGKKEEADRLARQAATTEAKAETTLEHAIEVPQVAPVREAAPIRTSAGTLNAQKEWQWELEDISKVPDQYVLKTINTAAVNLAVRKNNVREIPGIKVWEGAKIQVRR